MKVPIAALLVIAGLLSVADTRADDITRGPPLRLDDVVAAADRTYPSLKAAELERVIASADLLSAEGGFDLSWKTRGTVLPVAYYDSVRVESVVEAPTTVWGVTPFAGYKLGTGRFAVYDGRLQTLEYGEVRAGVNVPLWRNGPIDRRRANLGRAEIGLDVARLSADEQRIQVRRAAAQRYWAWVASGMRVAIAERLLANAEGRDAGLAARVDRGDLPPIERIDNVRAVEQRKAQVASSTRALEQAAIELGLFVRDGDGRPAPPAASRLPATLPEPGNDAIGPSDLNAALSQRPEPRRFELQLRQTQIELAWAKNQLAPGIDLQLAGSQDFGRRIPDRPDLSHPIFEITLLLDIPLQTRVMRGRADAASASGARFALQRDFARDRVEADVRDAQSGIRRARERVDASRREIGVAMDLESAERTRFDQGDSHLLIVNIREQQTAEAQLRAVEALFDYHRAAADLQAARGDMNPRDRR